MTLPLSAPITAADLTSDAAIPAVDFDAVIGELE